MLFSIGVPDNVDFGPPPSYVDRGFRFAPKTQNFMRWMAYDTCARPFWVLMVTFVPAFIEAWLTVKIWDMNDILREQAKGLAAPPPRGGLRGGRHAKIGKVPGKEPPPQKWSRGGLAHLLRWTQPIENIGFALLLYGAADQFFYRWQSLIEAVAPCDVPLGSFSRSAAGINWSMLFAGGPARLPTLDQNTANWNTNAFIVGLPPGNYFCAFSAKLRPVFAASYPAGIELVTPGIVGDTLTQSGIQQLNTGTETDYLIIARFFVTGFGGTTVGWRTYGSSVPVGVHCVEATCVISRSINSLAI